jgi:hypothetical protein
MARTHLISLSLCLVAFRFATYIYQSVIHYNYYHFLFVTFSLLKTDLICGERLTLAEVNYFGSKA